MMHDGEKSDVAIVAGKPMSKAGQTVAELVESRAGAIREPAKHIPGAEPGTCATGAGARTTSPNAFCRQSNAGAACGNSAYADLCGGRPVTAVPIANLSLA